MKSTEATVKKAGSQAINFAMGILGLSGGTLLASKVPAMGPAILQKILPGLLNMGLGLFISHKWKDEKAQSLAFGLGLSGFANVVNKFTASAAAADPSGILAKVNKATALPSLGSIGMNTANYGQYDADYFNPDRKPRPLNGTADRMANSLTGPDQQAFSLTGGMFFNN